MNFLKLFEKPSLIAAHRGARSVAPENTLKALKMSLGHCDFIEIDVQLSKDYVPIIMHDDTLERTTNVKSLEQFKSRKPYFVHDFTFEELKQLDYGEGESLLTLHAALSFIKENNFFINVEIKDAKSEFKDQEVVKRVLKEIIALKVEERVLISSFRHAYLPLCKQILPNLATAALVEDIHPKNLLNYLKKLGVEAYHMNDELVDKETISKLKNAGFFVNIYTVNDTTRQKELFQMGVNGVFSDFVL
jgi:glycerophosphoryl diester phosphodiesterase